MKKILTSLLLAGAVVSAQAFIFFGGGGTPDNAYHADNVDNGFGTNVVLQGRFAGDFSGHSRYLTNFLYATTTRTITTAGWAYAPLNGTWVFTNNGVAVDPGDAPIDCWAKTTGDFWMTARDRSTDPLAPDNPLEIYGWLTGGHVLYGSGIIGGNWFYDNGDPEPSATATLTIYVLGNGSLLTGLAGGGGGPTTRNDLTDDFTLPYTYGNSHGTTVFLTVHASAPSGINYGVTYFFNDDSGQDFPFTNPGDNPMNVAFSLVVMPDETVTFRSVLDSDGTGYVYKITELY